MLSALLPLAATAFSAITGQKNQQKANRLADRQLQSAEQDYASRAPLRLQGMQALGQIEAPMDLGNLGFNSSNPFAAARGPAPSTASYGDWGRMTSQPTMTPAAPTAQENPVVESLRALSARGGNAARAANQMLQGIQKLGGR